MTVILFAIPAFFLLIGIEWYVDARSKNGHYRINDALTSLSAGVLSRLISLVHQLIPLTMYVLVFDALAVTALPNSAWTWLAAFIIYDFFYYWNHRMGHEMSILWAAHVVHHSSEDYNLTTALRQTSGALFSWIFYLPMAMMGFPPEMVITVAALNLVYQFWVHTQYIDKLGWMEWVFVTPSNHRVHHAQNRVYIDKNYGGVFILWDRLFGTFIPEMKNAKPVYGIRGALKSFNPVWANLQVYSQLIHDSYHTKRWRDKWRVWFGRTGWRPTDVAQKYPVVKTSLADFKKYNPTLLAPTNKYCVLQHILMLATAVYLLLNAAVMSGAEQAVLMVSVLLSCIQIGFVLQQSKMALALEGPRLLALPLLWLAVGLPVALVTALLTLHAISLIMLLWVVRQDDINFIGDVDPDELKLRKWSD